MRPDQPLRQCGQREPICNRGLIFFLIIVIVLAVAWRSGKPSARRIVAVLAGCLAWYGAGVSVNALSTDIISWLPTRNGMIVSTGDIMIGLMIAGSGLGLLAAMFIRDPDPHPEPEASSEAAERAAASKLR